MRDLLLRVLTDTLALWNVRGSVEPDGTGAAINTSHAIVRIERAPDGVPFRWLARWRSADEPAGDGRERRPRGCASFVGVLSALRAALAVERGTPLRIAPAARENLTEREGRIPAPARTTGDTSSARERVPVSILTGFLGSGKTTLLRHLLRDPEMGRTAIIINEFGEIGLDHDLIETSDETTVSLTTGCLCCKVTSDLALTLRDLAHRRAAGVVPRFERVVIETSGLADPAPILHALMIDPTLRELYVAQDVITTVDALTGLSSLEHYPESLKQAALAETIVLTKTDVPEAQSTALAARLRMVNPHAPVLQVVRGDIAPSRLFDGGGVAARMRDGNMKASGARGNSHRHDHTSGVQSFTLVRDRAIHAATLPLFLSALAENCGGDLLRMKGLVRVAEDPEHPAAIHGVQHVYSAPEWLARWPSDDRRTRMVFIGRNLHQRWVDGVLELAEAEVSEALRTRSAASV